MALAAGVSVMEIHPYQGWHRGCGNGMVVGNVGMAVLSALACLMPRDKFNPYLDAAIKQRDMQGIPEIVKYHGGWKKWKLEVFGQNHTYDSREAVLKAASFVLETQKTAETESYKALSHELKEAGLKAARKKVDLVEAIVRLRYKEKWKKCLCCQEAWIYTFVCV